MGSGRRLGGADTCRTPVGLFRQGAQRLEAPSGPVVLPSSPVPENRPKPSGGCEGRAHSELRVADRSTWQGIAVVVHGDPDAGPPFDAVFGFGFPPSGDCID